MQTNDYVTVFKALANEHRLKIYLFLTRCCPPGTCCTEEQAFDICVSDIDQQLDIAPSTLSHHLKELYRADLVSMHKKGKHVYYCINVEMMNTVKDFFSNSESNQI